jgi:hypothetical protein
MYRNRLQTGGRLLLPCYVPNGGGRVRILCRWCQGTVTCTAQGVGEAKLAMQGAEEDAESIARTERETR